MTKANFIGIGAQKCASTWAYGVLGQFPDVHVSETKEVDFFTAFFDRGYEWYGRHFAEGASHRFRGEVSPSYLYPSDVPARVRAYAPDMKILVTLRDPVERSFSNHLHEARAGHISGANLVFENGLENNPLYRHQGLYALHLARWLEAFPADQIHVTFQEDVKADGPRETQRLAAFFGLPVPDELVQRRANESIDYKNRAIGTALWRVGKAARKAGLGQMVESIKQAPGVRQMREANQKDMRAEIAPMRPETAAALTEFFAPDVERLAGLIGRQPPWKRFA